MRELIEDCRMSQDSIGGVVECAIKGVPVGIGSPMFDGVENVIASMILVFQQLRG